MILEEKKQYGSVCLLNIECMEPWDWNEGDATHVRVCLPTARENQRIMRERGFEFADRTLGVSINLHRSRLDFKAMVRLKPELVRGKKEEILEIAKTSFPTDRRFQVAPDYDERLSQEVLAGWIEELEESYVCLYKGQVIGFLALKDCADGRSFVHLAAVKEQYRMTGAALSLYANAADMCKMRGQTYLDGRISSTNTAVMNLYARLGAAFLDPMDVFLKEVVK